MATESARTSNSSQGLKSDRNETCKLLGFAVVVVVIYFCAEAIGTSLQAARSSIADLPTPFLIICFALVMLMRRLIPPIWYIVPTGAVMVVVLVDQFGLVHGVLWFQSLKLLDLLSVYVVHRVYDPILRPYIDGNSSPDEDSLPSFWWLPRTFVQAIALLDREWGHRAQTIPPWQQPAFVCAFGVSWYVEEEAMLYWFALRSRVGALPFAVGLVSYTFLNVPDMLVRARIFAAAIDATAESSLSLFVEALKDSNVVIVTIMLIIAAPATIYIHSTHIRLLSEGSLFIRLLSYYPINFQHVSNRFFALLYALAL